MPAYEKMESLKNGGSWGKFWWKTCGFEWVKVKRAACLCILLHHMYVIHSMILIKLNLLSLIHLN